MASAASGILPTLWCGGNTPSLFAVYHLRVASAPRRARFAKEDESVSQPSAASKNNKNSSNSVTGSARGIMA